MLVEMVSEESFAGLAEEWDDLLSDAEAPNAFLTWAWVSSWRATLGCRHRLRVATARRPGDGHLIGIAPLAVDARTESRLLRYRALQFLGQGPAAPDHLDLILRAGHEHAAEPLWSAIVGRGGFDVISLDGLRPGSRLADLMTHRRTDRARSIESTACPMLVLPDSWEEYEASLGRNLRQNLRRYARKLDREAGKTVTERQVIQPDEVDTTIQDLATLHQQVWTARGARGAFADKSMVDFHRLVAARFLEAGRLRLYRLDVGSDLAAVIYCFRYGDVFYFYQTAYEMELSRYGPGRRIMAHAIRAAIEEGARVFDFLRGDEAYKQSWGATSIFDERMWMPVSRRGSTVGPLRGAARRTRGAMDAFAGSHRRKPRSEP